MLTIALAQQFPGKLIRLHPDGTPADNVTLTVAGAESVSRACSIWQRSFCRKSFRGSSTVVRKT